MPRARENRVVGILDEGLRIRVTAPPARGEANRALIKFLAHELGIKSRDVEILAGHTSRSKRIRITGVTPEEIESALLP